MAWVIYDPRWDLEGCIWLNCAHWLHLLGACDDSKHSRRLDDEMIDDSGKVKHPLGGGCTSTNELSPDLVAFGLLSLVRGHI